jgi:hypothetical protein
MAPLQPMDHVQQKIGRASGRERKPKKAYKTGDNENVQ